jgi:LPS-assembly lipoprotein
MTRHLLLGAALAGVASLLSACGFQPLYAQPTGVVPALSAIAVDTPGTRMGHLIREQLEDEFGTDADVPPRYRLTIDIQERRTPRGLRSDDTANRYQQRVTTRYRLREINSQRQLLSGGESAAVTYDVADAPYSGVMASLDGQERAANEAARLIRTDLARFFADGRDKPARRPTRR